LKRPTPGDSNEIKALMIRANNAERRLANAQNQLAAAEEKMAAMNQKTAATDSKWEARVKEYETRLRAAEEKVKRERQGYKERVLELENQVKCVFGWPYGSNVVLIGPFVKVSTKTKRSRGEAESTVGGYRGQGAAQVGDTNAIVRYHTFFFLTCLSSEKLNNVALIFF